MDESSKYIHGTEKAEQSRLASLNKITNETFINYLAIDGRETILEVGSGLGILTNEIASKYPDCKIFSIEYYWSQIAEAKKNTLSNISFCQADAHSIPAKDESFDLVFCRYVLEHVANPSQVLSEMRRVLNNGGRIMVQENNILINDFYPDCPRFENIWNKFADLQSKLGGDAVIGKKLFPLLKDAGFKEIELSIEPEIHYSGSPYFRSWVENLIGNIRSCESGLLMYGLATQEEIESSVAELEAFTERNDATALFYWNRAKAVK
jgi:SAM-dependent methyltransferase